MGAACALPLGHQVTETGRGGAPVLGVGELLRLLDQLFLAVFGACALPVEVGEMRPAAAVEGLTGAGEPLPELLVGLAVDPADGAPLVEDRLEAVACLLPLGGLRSELFGLGGQLLLARDGGGALGVARGPRGDDRGLGVADQLLEPCVQSDEVAEDGRFVQAVPHRARRAEGVFGISSGDEAVEEDLDLGGHVVEPACEVGEPFVRSTCLPRADHPLAVSGRT